MTDHTYNISQNATIGKFCYSHNEEDFYGAYDTREEALEAGRDEDKRVIWTGRLVHAIEFLLPNVESIGESILERSNEQLSDEIGGDDAIMELESEQCKDLGRLVVEWLRDNACFYREGVQDIEYNET